MGERPRNAWLFLQAKQKALPAHAARIIKNHPDVACAAPQNVRSSTPPRNRDNGGRRAAREPLELRVQYPRRIGHATRTADRLARSAIDKHDALVHVGDAHPRRAGWL